MWRATQPINAVRACAANVDVGAGVQQRLYHSQAAFFSGPHQWCLVSPTECVFRRSLLQEERNYHVVSVMRINVESRETIVCAAIHIGTSG